MRPVGGQESTKVEELDIDFRVIGLSHSVVKEAEHLRVQELVTGSKHILIEQYFKPICSRKTSTIHSATIRRRWCAKCVMWSHSSCAKLHQKYNVLAVSFIGIKELCIALADNACFYREFWRKFNNLRLDALSIPLYVIKKGANHEVQRLGWTCDRRPYIQTHSRGKEKIPRTMESHLEQVRQKWAYEVSIWLQSRCLDEQSLTPRIRRTNWRARPSRSTKTHTTRTRSFSPKITCPALELINMLDGNIGLHFQVPRGGTHPNGVGSELTKFFVARISFFVTVGFVYRITCTRRGVWTEHPHTAYFLAHLHTFHPCSLAQHGSWCCSACLIKNMFIHLSSCVWSCVVSPSIDFFPVFRVSLHFAHSTYLIYPGHQPPCGRNRRVLNPMRTRRMRSVAPWEKQGHNNSSLETMKQN